MARVTIVILFLLIISQLASAKILLIGENTSLSFDDIEANFTPLIKRLDQGGVLYVAEPLDACSDFVKRVTEKTGSRVSPQYVLIIRGGCSFEDKIRNAQKAGYKAAIVYDYDDNGFLVSMAGNPSGVHIHATFVSKATGEVLKEYAGRTDFKVRIMPNSKTSVWSIMAISFIFLLSMSAALATCFFVRRHRIRRWRSLSPNVSNYPRMTNALIRLMPIIKFNGVCDEASTSVLCAICTEDYLIGEKLRLLPCHHRFHVECVDVWLGQRRSFCPVCKRDARSINIDMPASEHTPLLSPSFTPTSSFLLSSPSTTPLQSSHELPIATRTGPSSPSTSMHQTQSLCISPTLAPTHPSKIGHTGIPRLYQLARVQQISGTLFPKDLTTHSARILCLVHSTQDIRTYLAQEMHQGVRVLGFPHTFRLRALYQAANPLKRYNQTNQKVQYWGSFLWRSNQLPHLQANSNL